jgi:beta-lactam-binding protein with PASTA domain
MIKKIKDFVLSKHFLKHFGLIVLFYLVAVFITVIYLNLATNHGEKIAVPNFTGMSSDEAKQKIEELGLEFQVLDSIYDPKLPEGTVVEQLVDPTALSKVYVKTGRAIGLRLSKKSELVEMPSLVHKQVQFAESILESRSLRFDIRYRSTSEENGSVLEQLYKGRRIQEGEKIPRGAVVILIVGQNDLGEPILTPNLVGLFMDEVKMMLDTTGFTSYNFICSDCFTKEDSVTARVFGQTPEYIEGKTVLKSTHFTINMSKSDNGIGN